MISKITKPRKKINWRIRISDSLHEYEYNIKSSREDICIYDIYSHICKKLQAKPDDVGKLIP